jgi:hypothetical protein
MDDATRAELAELRRRAFGPLPDIAGDSAAMARLAVLEDLSQDEHTAGVGDAEGGHAGSDAFSGALPADSGHAGRAGGAVAGPVEGRETDAEPFALATHPLRPAALADGDRGAPRRRRRRSGAGVALGAAVIATLVVFSTAVVAPQGGVHLKTQDMQAAYALAVDPNARVLVQVPLHSWYGSENAPTLPSDAPPFPASGTMQWATNLGSYYGWHLWIGGARGILQEEVCIAVSRGDTGKGRCVAEPLRSSSALAVTLPLRDVPEGDRPAALVPGKRLGFWWFHDSAVTIMLTSGPEEE